MKPSSLTELEDSLANSSFKSLKDFFQEKPSERIIKELILNTQEILSYTTKLFPQLSDFIIQLQPWLSSSSFDLFSEENPFLYAILLDKGLAPKPKSGDPILYHEYKGSDFNPCETKVFYPYEYKLKERDFCPELKDPRFLFGFGFSMRDDNLEGFIQQVQGKEEEQYKYLWWRVTLKDMAASFGSERIWFYLSLNGFCEGYLIEMRAFGGRNMAIIKDVLNKTTRKVDELLNYAWQVFNFEVFSYLIDQDQVEIFNF